MTKSPKQLLILVNCYWSWRNRINLLRLYLYLGIPPKKPFESLVFCQVWKIFKIDMILWKFKKKISSSDERFGFYSHFNTSTLIKSKNLKNRRTSIQFYGKSVLLFDKFFFTIEIVAQFSLKLKKNYLHPMNGLDFTSISKLQLW